jgi:hypothetical protein
MEQLRGAPMTVVENIAGGILFLLAIYLCCRMLGITR